MSKYISSFVLSEADSEALALLDHEGFTILELDLSEAVDVGRRARLPTLLELRLFPSFSCRVTWIREKSMETRRVLHD